MKTAIKIGQAADGVFALLRTMSDERQIFYLVLTLVIIVGMSSCLILFAGLKLTLIVTAIVICLSFSYRYPRSALWIFLIYLPFAGTVTYGFGGAFRAVGSQVSYNPSYGFLHLAKDAFYLPALLALIFNNKLQSLGQKFYFQFKPLILAIICLFGVCLLTLILVNGEQQLQALPPEQPFLMGIIGLKTLIGYIPLLLCAYYLIRHQRDLVLLQRLHLVLILICCSLTIIQYLLLLNGICPGNINLEAPATTQATLQARCLVGGSLLYNPELGLIRLPGTFVAPWQWAWFLIASSFVSFATAMSESSRRWQLLSFLTIALVLIATLLSGQRTALLLVPSVYLVLLVLTEGGKQGLLRKLAIAFLISLVLFSNFPLVQERISSFIARWQYSPPHEFIMAQFKWILSNRLELLGHGLGRATSAARLLGDIQLIETFYPKLLYEVGILGVITFLMVVSWLTILTFRAYRSLKSPQLSRFAVCIWVFILFISYNTFYYPLTVDPVAVYYWFWGGVLLKLPEIEQEQAWNY